MPSICWFSKRFLIFKKFVIWIEASWLFPFPDCLAGLLKPTGKKTNILSGQYSIPFWYKLSSIKLWFHKKFAVTKVLLRSCRISQNICLEINDVTETKVWNGTFLKDHIFLWHASYLLFLEQPGHYEEKNHS